MPPKAPDVLMPPAIEKLPRDERGYPVFFSIQDPNGGYDFRFIHPAQIVRCARERLCGLCGEPLGYWIAFVGGPRSLTSRAFIDPPMHPVCVDYARQVCPFLLRHGWDRAKVVERDKRAGEGTYHPEGFVGRPENNAIAVTRSFEPFADAGTLMFRAAPFKSIAWLNEDPEAVASAEAVMRETKEKANRERMTIPLRVR